MPESLQAVSPWCGPVEGTARELLAEAEADLDDEGRDAAGFLSNLVAPGAMQVKEVKRHADEAGFAWRSVQRAMKRAGVESRRGGFGQPATWALTGSRATVAPVTPDSENGANGANGRSSARMDPPPSSLTEAFDL